MKKVALFKKKSDGTHKQVAVLENEQEAQDYLLDLVEESEDHVSIFDYFTEEVEYEDIRERVKSYEDACKVLGIQPHDAHALGKQGFRSDEIARRELETITEALNEGWKPNWNDTNEYKYYPWFYIEPNTNGACAGLSCTAASSAATNSDAYVGSRLCFHDSDTARYAGRQFTKLYEQILLD